MEQGKNYKCKLCPALLFESGAAVHFQRVHDRQYGRVILWKCAECGLDAKNPEQQKAHDEAVKEKRVACVRRARLNEEYFQKFGPISRSRRNPSLDLARGLPDALPKFFEALQIVKQNTLANVSVDEADEDCLMVPIEDEGRPRSAPPPMMMVNQGPARRFNYGTSQRGDDEQVPCGSGVLDNKDQGDVEMAEEH